MAENNRIDYIWSQNQLGKSGISSDAWVAVNKLIGTWNDLDLDSDQVSAVVSAFSELASGHSLLAVESDEVWVDAIPGSVHTGDVIRVKHDAYSGVEGEFHNGRIGRVIGVRSGMVFFRSTDDTDILPQIDGARHRFDRLQVRVL